MSTRQKKTALVVAHTHWDREWRYPIWKTRSLLLEFMDWLIDILENDPEYESFLMDGQTVCLDDYLEIRPENRDRIAALVKAGKLAVGPWYTLPDLFPIAGECLVRNLQTGIRFAEELGGYNPIAYHTFGWGQTAQFPQIYRDIGIEHAVAAKKVSEERAPNCEFMWTAPDGSELLTSRLGHFTRQNGYFYLHFPVRLNNIYDNNVYSWDWGKTGVAYHRADEENFQNDYFRVDHEDGYFKENVKDAAQRTWDNMDKTLIDDWRLLMCGCDFSTPNPYLPKMVADCNEALPDIEFRMSSLQEYFAGVDERIDRSTVPVVHGELRDGEPCGASANALATRIHIKQLNKKVENSLMRRTEPLAAGLSLLGETYPQRFLQKGWNYLLKSHPHDSINGVTQDKTVDDNMYRLNQALEISETIYEDMLASLLKRLDLSAFGQTDTLLLLHNPQPRPVREVIKMGVDTPRSESVWTLGIADADGSPLAIQEITRDEHKQPVHDIEARPWPYYVDRHQLYLDTGEIPAGGYKVVKVVNQETYWREEEWWPSMRKHTGGFIGQGATQLENEFLKVEVNTDGTFNLTDKQNGRVIENMHHFEDEGDTGDYWAYYAPYRNQIITNRGFGSRIWMEDNGPLSATIGIETVMKVPAHAEYGNVKVQGFGKRSERLVDLKIVSRITLNKDSKHVKVKTSIDNTAKDHRVRLMIPTDIKTDFSDAAGHFTVDRRGIVHDKDENGEFFPEMALRPMSVFCDANDGANGLAVLNNCLTEFQLLEDDRGTLALTLLRAIRNRICTESRVSSEFPEALGSQMLQTVDYEYAIYPHAGNWDEGKVYAEADKLNSKPAVTQISMNRGGELPTVASHYAIDNESLVLSSVKKAEDREGMVLRLFNPTDEIQEGKVSIGLPVSRAWKLNLIEKRGEELSIEDGSVSLSLEKGKIATIEVE
ncbi:alpha-mannosidase [Pontiella sulfatireligans]|uniref:Mannosylglycerate hydrolase n=1 Tax=Pontiella sulfatireligans TaxID=2750658 RepID=A0A6C2UJM3_9BACT|nr:glycoside hydrolase family 38 C-terminal domain-containing protein [Pontiella sulfatireligans]VGO19514.1 Mannosylglycerate hydrolase [Pontiella sulfatireligans]